MRTDLLAWIEDPSAARGIRFARDDGGWDFVSYACLAADTRSAAAAFAGVGLDHGSVVSIIVPTGPAFVAAYFGALLAGLVPAPLVPPTIFQRPDEYVEHTGRLIGAAASLVVTEAELTGVVEQASARAGLDRPPLELALSGADASFDRRAPADLALLQFTSGSSGHPRGVRVTWDNLQAMIDHIFTWVPWGEDDAGAHWLPLYHDFGLIGCLLAPTTRQRDLWVLRPDQFVRTPARWLECFGREGAAFAATPNFAFAYLLRKLDRDTLPGQDFSNWRGAIIGAERIDPSVLERFARMLEPYGFRRETYMPAYGLAEATLGVTGVPADRRARAVHVDWSSLQLAQPVSVADSDEFSSEAVGDGSGWLVGCGPPHPGLTVRILDEHGEPLPDGSLGEIEVRGATVADGYLGDASGGMSSFRDGALRTGDAGFVIDGELFVAGRLGDAVKLRGRSVYAEDLEAKLCVIDGVPRGRCVVIPGASEDGEALVAIVETSPGEWSRRAERVLLKEAGPGVRVQLWSAPPGTIPRTSSGKPRRRVLWQQFVGGSLPLEPVAAAAVES